LCDGGRDDPAVVLVVVFAGSQIQPGARLGEMVVVRIERVVSQFLCTALQRFDLLLSIGGDSEALLRSQLN
jgi:hypothetical protein